MSGYIESTKIVPILWLLVAVTVTMTTFIAEFSLTPPAFKLSFLSCKSYGDRFKLRNIGLPKVTFKSLVTNPEHW